MAVSYDDSVTLRLEGTGDRIIMNLASRMHGPHKRSALMRFSMSGRLTPLLIGLLCISLVGATLEFGHGHLHVLTAKLDPQVVVPQYPSGPGGQDVLRLSRTASSIGEDPEFLSVTLLPGRGMNVFQIMALVPGRGDVPLLASPSLASAASLLNGQGVDSSGTNSTALGGALLLPWARRLTGAPVSSDASTPLLQTEWQGQMFQVPADAPGSSTSVEGLLLKLVRVFMTLTITTAQSERLAAVIRQVRQYCGEVEYVQRTLSKNETKCRAIVPGDIKLTLFMSPLLTQSQLSRVRGWELLALCDELSDVRVCKKSAQVDSSQISSYKSTSSAGPPAHSRPQSGTAPPAPDAASQSRGTSPTRPCDS